MPPAAVGLAALGVAAVGTGYSIYAGEKANKLNKAAVQEQRNAQEAQRKRDNLAAARQRRDVIRTARLAYSTAQQTAENQGVTNSSASQGGLASIASQMQSNISFLDQYGFYSDQASGFLQKAADLQGKANKAQGSAQTASQVAGLGMTVFNNSDRITKVFNGG